MIADVITKWELFDILALTVLYLYKPNVFLCGVSFQQSSGEDLSQ